MIDRPARDLASSLLRRLRDGELTNYEFENAWPTDSKDPALGAISAMAWTSYGDLREHRLTGRRALTSEGHEVFTRSALFLQCDFHYEWPKANLIRIGGVGRVFLTASLGLLWPLDRWIKRRNRLFEEKLRTLGDPDVWPFIRLADYEECGRAK